MFFWISLLSLPYTYKIIVLECKIRCVCVCVRVFVNLTNGLTREVEKHV